MVFDESEVDAVTSNTIEDPVIGCGLNAPEPCSTDISKGHVSEILRGVSSPSVTTLIKLAEALEVEVKDFFVFPESNKRHRVIALLETCPSETLEAICGFSLRRTKPGPSGTTDKGALVSMGETLRLSSTWT